MLAAAVRAQTAVPPADYSAAVQAYAVRHDAARAVAGLVGWTPNHFQTAIEKYPAQPQPRLAAAAALQIEAGVAREGWHDVKVTLKGARGDVIARPGYFVADK